MFSQINAAGSLYPPSTSSASPAQSYAAGMTPLRADDFVAPQKVFPHWDQRPSMSLRPPTPQRSAAFLSPRSPSLSPPLSDVSFSDSLSNALPSPGVITFDELTGEVLNSLLAPMPAIDDLLDTKFTSTVDGKLLVHTIPTVRVKDPSPCFVMKYGNEYRMTKETLHPGERISFTRLSPECPEDQHYIARHDARMADNTSTVAHVPARVIQVTHAQYRHETGEIVATEHSEFVIVSDPWGANPPQRMPYTVCTRIDPSSSLSMPAPSIKRLLGSPAPLGSEIVSRETMSTGSGSPSLPAQPDLEEVRRPGSACSVEMPDIVPRPPVADKAMSATLPDDSTMHCTTPVPMPYVKFSSSVHTMDISIYCSILGEELIFRNETGWNIEHPEGIERLWTRLCGGRLAFATFSTGRGMFVYFAITGTRQASQLETCIHEAMGREDQVATNPFTFVDANRRFKRHVPDSEAGEMFAAMGIQTSACETVRARQDPLQIVRDAIRLDVNAGEFTTDIHLNCLFAGDTNACAGVLKELEVHSGRNVTLVCHQHFEPMVINSRHGAARAMQRLSEIARKLTEHGARTYEDVRRRAAIGLQQQGIPVAQTSQIANELAKYRTSTGENVLTQPARHLLREGMLVAQMRMLRVEHFDDSPRVTGIKAKCAIAYIRLVGCLIRAKVLPVDEVLEALQTPAGVDYISQLGKRICFDVYLLEAFVAFIRTLQHANAQNLDIARMLLRKPSGFDWDFYNELLALDADLVPYRNSLLKRLGEMKVKPKTVVVGSMVPLRQILKLQQGGYHIPPEAKKRLNVRSWTLAEALDYVVHTFSASALNVIEAEQLRKELNEIMPSLSVGEQRQIRASAVEAVDQMWQEEFPGEQAGSSLTRSILDEVGRRLGAALSQPRKAEIDALVASTQARWIHCRSENPHLSDVMLEREFDTIVADALQGYESIISGDSALKTDVQALVHAHARDRVQAAVADDTAHRAVNAALGAAAAQERLAEAARRATAAQAAKRAMEKELSNEQASVKRARDLASFAKEQLIASGARGEHVPRERPARRANNKELPSSTALVARLERLRSGASTFDARVPASGKASPSAVASSSAVASTSASRSGRKQRTAVPQ
ncbi:hypothetical protein [Pandoraea faecigallinarum]|uniref:hypothetical protein n=1 Tax=Pandoraea faecigallinarum TaxID=656179 RepID=UPI0012F51A11|nr:hypothetical protein [Pandoraea faecigallinarum]